MNNLKEQLEALAKREAENISSHKYQELQKRLIKAHQSLHPIVIGLAEALEGLLGKVENHQCGHDNRIENLLRWPEYSKSIEVLEKLQNTIKGGV